MSEFRDFAQRIQQFLETDGSGVKKLAYDLTQSKLSNKQIVSLLWSFLSLSKSATLFKEDSINLIYMILCEIAEINSDFANLLYITLDKADFDVINSGDSLIEKKTLIQALRLCNSKKFNITKYQYLEKNPEGFACLLLALMKNRADDLIQIIGEHNLDPDSVLLILIDLIGFKNAESTKKFRKMLLKFNVNRTINMLVQKMDQNYMPGHIQILFYMFKKIIPIEKQIPILSHLGSVLEKLKALLSDATDDFCRYIRRPRTIIPGEPKYSSDWLKMQKLYLNARKTLYKSPHFRIEFSTIEINKIFKYAQYDPCSIPALAEYVTNYLIDSIEKDPNNFFKSETNMRLISILTCHCTSNKLIVLICRLEEIPAEVFVNFLLPAMSVDKCGWQLSEIIFKKMSSLYNFSERCQIYRRIDSIYNIITDLRVLTAFVTGRIAYIMKRITATNSNNRNDGKGNDFSYKFSKLLIKAPHVVSGALIAYIRDNTPIPPAEVLIRVLYDSSRFVNDIILWRFADTINNVKYQTHSEFISLPVELTIWPNFIGEFLGKFAKNNFNSFDLVGYLNFILNGLKQQKIAHVCLFSHLLYETTGIRYNGNLTKDEIEIRSGHNLSRIIRSLDSVSSHQHDFKNILMSEENNFALNILCALDSMHRNFNFENFSSDRVDDIQFTFVSLCDFMESNNWNPIELSKKYRFSYPSSFHISRESNDDIGDEVKSLVPLEIPVDLFTYFWRYGLKDMHVPKKLFEDTLKRIETEKDGADEEKKNKLELNELKLRTSMENQTEKVAEIERSFKNIEQDWFDESENVNIYRNFVQSCIMNRIIISQEDPIFCAKFVFLLAHSQRSFDICKFMLEFLRIFHFIISSSTITEANLYGIFVKKMLKYFNDQGDIVEEEEIHNILMQKINLLFNKKQTMLVPVRTIYMLNKITKYFPRADDHKKKILNYLKSLDLEKYVNIKPLVVGYKASVEKIPKNKKILPPPIKQIPTSNSQNDENKDESIDQVSVNEDEKKDSNYEDEGRTEDDQGDDNISDDEEKVEEEEEEEEEEFIDDDDADKRAKSNEEDQDDRNSDIDEKSNDNEDENNKNTNDENTGDENKDVDEPIEHDDYNEENKSNDIDENRNNDDNDDENKSVDENNEPMNIDENDENENNEEFKEEEKTENSNQNDQNDESINQEENENKNDDEVENNHKADEVPEKSRTESKKVEKNAPIIEHSKSPSHSIQVPPRSLSRPMDPPRRDNPDNRDNRDNHYSRTIHERSDSRSRNNRNYEDMGRRDSNRMGMDRNRNDRPRNDGMDKNNKYQPQVRSTGDNRGYPPQRRPDDRNYNNYYQNRNRPNDRGFDDMRRRKTDK